MANNLKGPGPGKPLGPNKKTKQLKEALSMLLEDKFEEFKSMMSMLKPSEYCRLYADLLKYRLPAMQSVAVKDETEEGKRAAYHMLTDLRKGVINHLPVPDVILGGDTGGTEEEEK